MKFLFEFLPFVVFFIVYVMYDFFTATAALIVASLLQLGIYWCKYRKVEKMLLFSVALIVVFGGTTIIFQDEDILKWKTTVFSFVTAAVFFLSHFIGKRVLLQRIFSHFPIPSKVCRFWNMAWVLFLTFIGILNLFIAYHYSTKIWIYFKLFGFLGLTIVFLSIQAVALAKHLPKDKFPG